MKFIGRSQSIQFDPTSTSLGVLQSSLPEATADHISTPIEDPPSYLFDTRSASPTVIHPSFDVTNRVADASIRYNALDTDASDHTTSRPRQYDFGLNGDNVKYASIDEGVQLRAVSASIQQPAPVTILQPEHDGLSCTPYREGLIIIGGPSMKRIWRFSFRTMLWSCIITQGPYAPSGRLNHSVALCDDCLYVSGGSTYEMEDFMCVYKLDLRCLRWSKLPCKLPQRGLQHKRSNGAFNPSELEDSELERSGYGYTENVSYNQDISFAPCLKDVPLSRTHHASVVVGGNLYVHGGKPIYDNMALYDIRQLHSCCFFEMLEFNLTTFEWTAIGHTVIYEDMETGLRRTTYSPPPSLWGHSMVCMGSAALILFGGFEIDLASTATDGRTFATHAEYIAMLVDGGIGDDDQLPSAEMTALVNVFGLKTRKWASFAPRIMEPGPQPRALHVVHLLNDSEMIVLGGIKIDPQNNMYEAPITEEVTPCADGWVWNIESGTWRKLDPFPIPNSKTNYPNKITSAKLFSALYNDQLVIGNDISKWYVLDVSDPVEIRLSDTIADCERGDDSEVFYCAVVKEDDWQVAQATAPSPQDNPLYQEGLRDLGGVVHPRKRHMLYNMVYGMSSATRRGKRGADNDLYSPNGVSVLDTDRQCWMNDADGGHDLYENRGISQISSHYALGQEVKRPVRNISPVGRFKNVSKPRNDIIENGAYRDGVNRVSRLYGDVHTRHASIERYLNPVIRSLIERH